MNRYLRAAGWWTLTIAACAALALLLIALWFQSSDASLGRLASVATVGSAVLTIAAIAVAIIATYLAWRAISTPMSLELACEELSQAVAAEWRAEAAARGLANPQPIPVRWSSTRLSVSATAGEILNVAAEPGAMFDIQGDVTTVADRFRQLPARQLVIIGPPGAGKTSLAVILVRDLLATRESDEPVPVLLNASAWSLRVPFDTWIVRRLQEQYPQLTNVRRYGVGLAERLVKAGLILPVLDGLDEIRLERSRKPPEGADEDDEEQGVIDLLNSTVGDDRPLVVTCRRAEFEMIIGLTGRPLLRAAVVEIEPVTTEQARQYLSAGQVDGANRWAEVVNQITANPQGALASALSTPLNVFLARTAYWKADPSELATIHDPDDLRKHLLAEYLPATYAPRLAGGQVGFRQYSSGQARCWLGFIAIYTRQDGDGGCFDTFFEALKFDVRFAFGTPELMLGLVTAVLFGRTHGVGVGILAGVLYLGLAEFLSRRALILGITGRIGFGVTLAIASTVWANQGLATIPSVTIGISVAAIYLTLCAVFSSPARRDRLAGFQLARSGWKAAGRWPEGNFRTEPARFGDALAELSQSSRAEAIAAVFLGSLVFGIWFAALVGIDALLTAGFGYLILTELVFVGVAELLYRSASNILFGMEPKWLRSRRRVRRPRLRFRTIDILFLGFTMGFVLKDGIVAGAAAGIAGWLWFGPASRLLRQQVARIWLAAHGMLPWRLGRFLDDAYRRGVLRRSGGRLEFRHREIERFLADHSGWIRLKIE